MEHVLQYLERSAHRLPDQTAVVDEHGALTYAALLGRVRRVSSGLLARGIVSGPVAVVLEKSNDALTAFLGIAGAGAFYVLLSPELPEHRLGQIQSVLQAGWAVTDEAHFALARTLFPDGRILRIESLRESAVEEDALAAARARHLDCDPLYANFTSGSTGQPKGVLVSHRSVIDFIGHFTRLFDITQRDVLGNQAPFDFDVSVKDIYSALAVGATLAIIPRRLFSRPAELLDFVAGHGVTTLIWAVSALCLVTTFHALDYRVPGRVDKVLFSGEVMPERHLRMWMEKLPHATFVNLYGPTEITCNCTYHVVDRSRDYGGVLPIGRPFPNEEVFLLDGEDREITAPDAVGELCVRGTCLALGYYNDPEQTAAHFVPDPRNRSYPETIYRTGDLARWNESGELVFAGRKDFQIKHMGHRIELEEIERAMMAVPGVVRACCLFDQERGKLLGFYVGALEKGALHRTLSEALPRFMIPNRLVPLEEMPMTKNGKLDRAALRGMGGRRR